VKPDRSSCNILGLVTFGPGLHKGDDFYSPARCQQIVKNFARLSGYFPVTCKLGHDVQQRFATSFGFPSLGTVTRVTDEGEGYFSVDIENVPVDVGAQVNAGRLPGSSIELVSGLRDRADPSKVIPGDVLRGISLLGEEPPAVTHFPERLRGRVRPRATFADGTPVPPAREATPWLNKMAEVLANEPVTAFTSSCSTEYLGRQYTVRSVSFSRMAPTRIHAMLTAQPERNPADRIGDKQCMSDLSEADARERLTTAGFDAAQVVRIISVLGIGADGDRNPQQMSEESGPDLSAIGLELKKIGLTDESINNIKAEIGKLTAAGGWNNQVAGGAKFSANYGRRGVLSERGKRVAESFKHLNPRAYQRLTGRPA